MAKWLNKYFSLGNNKTKSPPQPPRPDYRDKRNGTAGAGGGGHHNHNHNHHHHHHHHHTSPCFPRHDTSDLLRAYRAQKERDFEDPYSGPGSSLRKLRALCRAEYCAPEELLVESAGPKPFSSSSCCGGGGGGVSSGGSSAAVASAPTPSTASASPQLFRSHSERRAATPPDSASVKYISPKHRLIKIESNEGGKGGSGVPITWSPPGIGGAGQKKLNKCGEQGEGGGGSVSLTKKEKVLIADDYSDPFDAKSEVNKMGKGENTGYMEPYEAQRIMTELQRQDSVKPQQKDIQLYDTPYEPEGNGVESDSESAVSQRLRESKLPQDDDRPADEYDQPWEWNKVTIPALAAQFNGGEIRQSSPSPSSSDRRRQLRAPGGGFKPIKHGSPEFCGILGERVDPTIPLEKQIWYHGAISRTDAENLLRLCKECSYLVRNSQTSKHDYSLSLKSNQGFMHMKLAKTKEKYILGQNSPPFDSVPEVIHYYTAKKLPIKGAEHLSLLYPVAVRTL
ncbi:SH2 domain-containing adapter protein B [Pantherophis guttatus]|uniref:SH2 domain-containing adapter protein B n=1 Tax=Pantherophis guttatus TaxID=94885 RepID=A0A6P9BEG8_PANGU|nr:SH2 domain-containing adapter protein B [Pantherophis guttatus]